MAIESVAKMRHNANVAVFGACPVALLYVVPLPTSCHISNYLPRRTMAIVKALGAVASSQSMYNPIAWNFPSNATDVHIALLKEPCEDNMAYAKRHVCLPLPDITR
ncbi:hypothetical protein N7532_010104 [Penicillium argentinense]|uniref:Uncharacterized protein n=1 Tax=Penicillium argentinense TaxID=1131581 RepID=A0A9W9JXL6_9EURO|nr:uncharacterized protein N7532_010104 [Penicillium argentinense]KAJ5085333.1 hypothetical protein N7532_010104 [Penicillium argentinense]